MKGFLSQEVLVHYGFFAKAPALSALGVTSGIVGGIALAVGIDGERTWLQASGALLCAASALATYVSGEGPLRERDVHKGLRKLGVALEAVGAAMDERPPETKDEAVPEFPPWVNPLRVVALFAIFVATAAAGVGFQIYMQEGGNNHAQSSSVLVLSLPFLLVSFLSFGVVYRWETTRQQKLDKDDQLLRQDIESLYIRLLETANRIKAENKRPNPAARA